MHSRSEITIQVPMKPSEPCDSMYGHSVSPLLKFFSGPSIEKGKTFERLPHPRTEPLEIDESVKVLMLETLKRADVCASDSLFSNASYDSEDNVSVISEVSTCSSAVTLETVDETERGMQTTASSGSSRWRVASFRSAPPHPDNSCKAKTPSLSDSGINCPSSASEAEDVEDGTRKLSAGSSKNPFKPATDLGSNGLTSSSFTNANGVSPEAKGAEADKSVATPVDTSHVKKRRSSLSRRISPAFSAIFSSGSLSSTGSSKTEPIRAEKEPKKNTQVRLRKLSLTMFHGKPSNAEREMKKRRNTDPSPAIVAASQINKAEAENFELKTDNQEISHPEKKELELSEVYLKDEDIRIRDLIEHVLRAHLLTMPDYGRAACDRAGRSISKILKTLVSSMKEAVDIQCKVVCQVFIGAVKEEGIFIATQALWNSDNDNFTAGSFRNDAVFGLGVVISTPIY